MEQAGLAAATLKELTYEKFPWAVASPSPTESHAELLLNNTWRPTLSVTGAEGMPAMVDAGNVQLPFVKLKLSFRLPPTCDADDAAVAVKRCG
jgi:hypothetical protein